MKTQIANDKHNNTNYLSFKQFINNNYSYFNISHPLYVLVSINVDRLAYTYLLKLFVLITLNLLICI